MAFLERLEAVGEPVTAAATASAPVDVMATFNGFLFLPRKNDADWVTTLFILSSFSFENCYRVPGRARLEAVVRHAPCSLTQCRSAGTTFH